MEKCCCLCLASLVNAKGKSRQKKVFGGKCQAEVQKLKECFAQEGCGGLENFSMDSTLCYECMQKLKDLRMKLNKSELKYHLSFAIYFHSQFKAAAKHS